MACCDNCRDYQRTKVYRWQFSNVPAGRWIEFKDIESYVNRVWQAQGLSFPPLVRPMPTQVTKWAGDATRATLRFPARGANERTILHEIAHAVTSTVHGGSDAHGPHFVTEFMRLLAKYLNVDIFALWYTATKSGVEYFKRV